MQVTRNPEVQVKGQWASACFWVVPGHMFVWLQMHDHTYTCIALKKLVLGVFALKSLLIAVGWIGHLQWGLMSNSLCITDFSGLTTYSSRFRKEGWDTASAPVGVWHPVTSTMFLPWFVVILVSFYAFTLLVEFHQSHQICKVNLCQLSP